MMKLFLAAIAILVSVVHSAPTSQYILYNPPIAPGRTVYKLPGTILQSTTPLKLADDGKQNIFYLLPPSTLTYPYQYFVLRDDAAQPGNNFDFWQVIQNWFGQAGGQGESGAAGESGAEQSEMKKIMQKFDMLDKDGNKMPEALKKEEVKRLYILSQQPHYLNTIQSIQYLPLSSPFFYNTPLIGRSRKLEADQPLLPIEQPVLAVVPAAAQVVPEPVPLVKAVEPLVDPVLVVDPLIAANPIPVNPVQEKLVPGPETPLQARSALEAEKEMMEEMIAEKEIEKKAEEEIKIEEIKEEIKLEEKKLEVKEADDPSVAQAKPAAIALSGKGGLSAASPVATSITGDGGIAVSAPQATSIAGDFPEVVEEEKKQ